MRDRKGASSYAHALSANLASSHQMPLQHTAPDAPRERFRLHVKCNKCPANNINWRYSELHKVCLVKAPRLVQADAFHASRDMRLLKRLHVPSMPIWKEASSHPKIVFGMRSRIDCPACQVPILCAMRSWDIFNQRHGLRQVSSRHFANASIYPQPCTDAFILPTWVLDAPNHQSRVLFEFRSLRHICLHGWVLLHKWTQISMPCRILLPTDASNPIATEPGITRTRIKQGPFRASLVTFASRERKGNAEQVRTAKNVGSRQRYAMYECSGIQASN